jgi:hypothetical protein
MNTIFETHKSTIAIRKSKISSLTPPNGPRITGHESRFIQNEPNFNRNSTIENHKSLHLFIRQRRTFTLKLKKMRNFCNFWTLMNLTPYIAKTYMNIHPTQRSTTGGSVFPKQRRWILQTKHENMQNEPNSTNNASSTTPPNGPRITGHVSRFMQNKPNSNRSEVTGAQSESTCPERTRMDSNIPEMLKNNRTIA